MSVDLVIMHCFIEQSDKHINHFEMSTHICVDFGCYAVMLQLLLSSNMRNNLQRELHGDQFWCGFEMVISKQGGSFSIGKRQVADKRILCSQKTTLPKREVLRDSQ